MKKNTSWKFTDESSVTFQLSVSGAGEFGLKVNCRLKVNCKKYFWADLAGRYLVNQRIIFKINFQSTACSTYGRLIRNFP